jgi:hypothetical protein
LEMIHIKKKYYFTHTQRKEIIQINLKHNLQTFLIHLV